MTDHTDQDPDPIAGAKEAQLAARRMPPANPGLLDMRVLPGRIRHLLGMGHTWTKTLIWNAYLEQLIEMNTETCLFCEAMR